MLKYVTGRRGRGRPINSIYSCSGSLAESNEPPFTNGKIRVL